MPTPAVENSILLETEAPEHSPQDQIGSYMYSSMAQMKLKWGVLASSAGIYHERSLAFKLRVVPAQDRYLYHLPGCLEWGSQSGAIKLLYIYLVLAFYR